MQPLEFARARLRVDLLRDVARHFQPLSKWATALDNNSPPFLSSAAISAVRIGPRMARVLMIGVHVMGAP